MKHRFQLSFALWFAAATFFLLLLLPATANSETFSALGEGDQIILLKNESPHMAEYSITLNDDEIQLSLGGYQDLPLRGQTGDSFTITWLGGANLSTPQQPTRSGTFGQQPDLYDGFYRADGQSYAPDEVSNAPLTSSRCDVIQPVDFYYVASSLETYSCYPDTGLLGMAAGYVYQNEAQPGERYSGWLPSGALSTLILQKGLYEDEYTAYNGPGQNDCLWAYTPVTPYLSFVSHSTQTSQLTLVNDCAAPVQYQVEIGDETQTILLAAAEQKTFSAPQGTRYTLTWLGGTDAGYAYLPPETTQFTGFFGISQQEIYWANDTNFSGKVADTISHSASSIPAGTLYAVDTLKTFRLQKEFWGWSYINDDQPGERYFARTATEALNKVLRNHPSYDRTADQNIPGYLWLFEPVNLSVVPRVEETTLSFSSTVVPAGTTGTFKVAALNVDGMPQSVNIAGVYNLKLNADGPGAAGSRRIGQYIEESGIDLLALSENFNYFSEIRDSAPSYSFANQRESIPTYVGLRALTDALFPFNTDGLNLMYRSSLSVSKESFTAWTTHYSLLTSYLGLSVPDQNGADGMISKGFRFYQVEMAPGVILDVYILHMDAETFLGDNAARVLQFQQLAEAINNRASGNPVLVLGDTNSRYTRDPLKTELLDATGLTDAWVELIRPEEGYPTLGDPALMVYTEGYQRGEVVDKVLYKNAEGNPLQIRAVNYYVDAENYVDEDGLLGDHPPVIVEFEYTFLPNSLSPAL